MVVNLSINNRLVAFSTMRSLSRFVARISSGGCWGKEGRGTERKGQRTSRRREGGCKLRVLQSFFEGTHGRLDRSKPPGKKGSSSRNPRGGESRAVDPGEGEVLPWGVSTGGDRQVGAQSMTIPWKGDSETRTGPLPEHNTGSLGILSSFGLPESGKRRS